MTDPPADMPLSQDLAVSPPEDMAISPPADMATGPCACASSTCVRGSIVELTGGSAAGKPVSVAAYDPLVWVTSPTPVPLAEITSAAGCYAFSNLASNIGIVAIVVKNASGGNGLVETAITAPVAAGQTTIRDAWRIEHVAVNAWAANGGIDYASKGAMLVRFLGGGSPVPGVQLLVGGSPSADTRYFSQSMLTVDPSLGESSALGAAVLPAATSLTSLSAHGADGGTWSTLPVMAPTGKVTIFELTYQ
jgi:hypothetical protein